MTCDTMRSFGARMANYINIRILEILQIYSGALQCLCSDKDF